MDGYQATMAIRGLTDDAKAYIPIIAMTANAFEEDKRKAFDSGMNGHIAKPIDVSELFRELSKVLAKKAD
jgi:CheY-like chemotaxis protein